MEMIRLANLSDDKKYRYSLTRIWNPVLPMVAWICLNPSTADAEKDDPTVRKIMGFSSRWGYGGFALLNLLALRATDPKLLLLTVDPVGPLNTIDLVCSQIQCDKFPDPLIVAWGNIYSRFRPRAEKFIQRFESLRCLGKTFRGNPLHPLMVPYLTPLVFLKGPNGENHQS